MHNPKTLQQAQRGHRRVEIQPGGKSCSERKA